MKTSNILLVLFCFISLYVGPVFGFSTHTIAVSRTFDKEEAVVSEPIMVTVNFTNLESNDLRGFYYVEQIPQELSINTISVRINGSNISNYMVESGSSGAVYDGCIPYRWIIERPSNFTENNPISQNSVLEVVYSFSSSQAGSFNFDEFHWVGFYQTAPAEQMAAFGHSEDTDKQTITFTEAPPIQHTLTVNTVGSGSVTLDPAGGTYNAGTEVQLTPVSVAGWAFNGWSGDLGGYSNPATIVMNSDKTITANFDLDGDTDGISDEEEDAGPNGGNGNDDNQLDSDQSNVATFHTQNGINYVTLESAAGTTLSDCSAVSLPSEPGAPSGVTFSYDFINFTINGAGAGGATTLILYLPAGANINTYWKYGPTPTNSNPHWYEFMYESSMQTGAEINGNKITLHFIDGQRGDDDVTTDGIIIDQGGPGTYSSGSPPDNGSGGGCFVRTAYGK